MTILTSVNRRFQTVWSDFIVQSSALYDTQNNLTDTNASDNCKLTALNFSNYSGYDGSGYGEGNATEGLTEQQAHDKWQEEFGNYQAIAKKQLIAKNIKKISQSVYDGLILYHWITGKLFYSDAPEGKYSLIDAIIKENYDTVADMIGRNTINNDKCKKAATVLRLADYGKNKNRTWMRTNGIHSMRDMNEKNMLDIDELKRARYAYYAETLKFLPFTPEGVQRDIVKRYNATIVRKNFTYSGTATFTLDTNFSMTPVEKLQVLLNGEILDHLFDYTIDGVTITITKTIVNNDIVQTIVKI